MPTQSWIYYFYNFTMAKLYTLNKIYKKIYARVLFWRLLVENWAFAEFIPKNIFNSSNGGDLKLSMKYWIDKSVKNLTYIYVFVYHNY